MRLRHQKLKQTNALSILGDSFGWIPFYHSSVYQTFISIHLHFLLSILLQQRLVSLNLHRPLRSFHAKIFKFYLFIKQAITIINGLFLEGFIHVQMV